MVRASRARWAALLAAAGAIIPMQSVRAAHASRIYLYSGPREGMRWGPVQATIAVRTGRIVDVKIGVSGDIVRSKFIERHALPALRQETLAAQSVYINTVSGATQTSEAYIESLNKAIAAAHRAGTLH
jgi:uncharacterized protein with FMN-binding domain